MNKVKTIIIILGIILGANFLVGYANRYFGWYVSERWKYRRETRGDILESKTRNVFIRTLSYELDPKIDSINFNVFIEKGFKYGKHSSKETKPVKSDTDFPYQVSFSQDDTLNKISFDLLPSYNADSLDIYCVYLKEAKLKDTLYIKMIKWENPIGNDSIGLIKIYDKK